jgi:hypothetical protein
MERKKPVPGALYRHFKGNIYQIRELAKHSETGEEMVVYQAMYPPFQIWVRSLEMFLEEIDSQRYPEAGQKFRFEEVRYKAAQPQRETTTGTAQKRAAGEPAQREMTGGTTQRETTDEAAEEITEEYLRQVLLDGQAEKKLSGKMTGEEIARQGFLAMLDVESFRDKRKIFMGLQPYLTSLYLSNIAVALDIVLEEGTDRQHYETILHCLETFEKYEGGRLRS